MDRQEHFLRPTKGDALPGAVIAVECAATHERTLAGSLLVREKLHCWAARAWRYKDGIASDPVEKAGVTADEWWDWLAHYVRSGGVTWIVSLHACRCMGLLDIWERLEEGRLRWSGDDYRGRDQFAAGALPGLRPEGNDSPVIGERKPSAAMQQLPGPDSGGALLLGVGGAATKSRGDALCVLEDPPTIVGLRLPTGGATLRWLDMRNWGLSGWDAIDPPDRHGGNFDPGSGTALALRLRWVGSRAGKVAAAFQSIVNLIQYYRWGSLKSTAGSQVWSAYRRRHLSHTVLIHCHADALRLERAAYVGGRNECYRLGPIPGPVYHLDFRALYPWVMQTCQLPARLVDYSERESEIRGVLAAGGHGVISTVEIDTPAPSYPLRKDGLIVFPRGQYRTTLAGPELADAAARGLVRRYLAAAWYEMEPLFAGVMKDSLDMMRVARDAGDQIALEVAKRMAVSLAGKVGQTGKRWVDEPDRVPGMPYGVWYHADQDGRLTRYRSVAWLCQREVIEGETGESMPAVAAWITSAARMRLLEALRVVGRSHCYYVYTDALVVDQAGYDRLVAADLVRADTPGYLRLLGRHERCMIHRIGHYALDGETRETGRPKWAGAVISQGEEQYVSTWVQEAISRGRRPEPTVRKIPARPGSEYKHGIVTADGRVLPLEERLG